MKLVSVVIPTFGGGEYLERAINSVIKQDYPEIEIIVVDDNGRGTQNQILTEQRVRSFIEEKKIHYVIHETNRNGAAARNTGVKFSKGYYIAFLDDDDIFRPQKISVQVKQLEQLDESWGMAYCSHIKIINGKYVETVNVKKSGELLYDILTHRVTVGSSSILIKREIFDKCGGFDETFRRHQDWEFTARVANCCKIVAAQVIGFERHLTFRNSANSYEKAQQHMDHYLDKMEFLIKKFSKRKQKIILLRNNLGIVLRYLRKGNPSLFIKRYKELNAGIIGMYVFFEMSLTYLLKMVLRKLL